MYQIIFLFQRLQPQTNSQLIRGVFPFYRSSLERRKLGIFLKDLVCFQYDGWRIFDLPLLELSVTSFNVETHRTIRVYWRQNYSCHKTSRHIDADAVTVDWSGDWPNNAVVLNCQHFVIPTSFNVSVCSMCVQNARSSNNVVPVLLTSESTNWLGWALMETKRDA